MKLHEMRLEHIYAMRGTVCITRAIFVSSAAGCGDNPPFHAGDPRDWI